MDKPKEASMARMDHPSIMIPLALLLSSAFGVVGCQTGVEPITGRPQFILFSPQQESELGLQAWMEIVEREDESSNRQRKEAVRRVGQRIASVVDRDYPGFNWEFRVFASDQANAFCLPGGRIGVYDGLFKYVDNDAELAAVIGHEVGHAVARHGAERMTQAMLVGLGALGVEAATRSQDEERRQRWLLAYGAAATFGYVLPYSRQHELAADHLGMIFMARAGYDPAAAISFWRKFARKPGSLDAIAQYVSTHPVGAQRVEQLHSILPRARLEYEKAENPAGLGVVY